HQRLALQRGRQLRALSLERRWRDLGAGRSRHRNQRGESSCHPRQRSLGRCTRPRRLLLGYEEMTGGAMRAVLLGCVLGTFAITAAAAATKPAAATAGSSYQQRADAFLDLVNAGYRALSRVSQEAQWEADTDVSSEH